AFMDAMRLDRAVIVGHSMGSIVAARVAARHPERTQALVLVGAFASRLDTLPVARQLWDEGIAALADPVDPSFVRAFQYGTIVRPVPEAFMTTILGESGKVPARVWRGAFESLLKTDASAVFS